MKDIFIVFDRFRKRINQSEFDETGRQSNFPSTVHGAVGVVQPFKTKDRGEILMGHLKGIAEMQNV
jgi:hypothetical protein